MTQLNIKHSVVAITVDRDFSARKGDILVVASDGTGQPAVLPGLSFEIAKLTNQVVAKKQVDLKKQVDSKNTCHFKKDRLTSDKPTLREREYHYLDTLNKYDEPCTTRDIATLCEEDYEKSHGAAQTNILRPMVTARLVEREQMQGTSQRNGVYGYSITRKGRRVLQENRNNLIDLKEVA